MMVITGTSVDYHDTIGGVFVRIQHLRYGHTPRRSTPASRTS
jgi:hypothetical protein